MRLLLMICDDESVAVGVATMIFSLSKLYGEGGEKLEQVFGLLQLMEKNGDEVGQKTHRKLAKLRDDAVRAVVMSLLTGYQPVEFVSTERLIKEWGEATQGTISRR
jgi:hypothetical protein